MPGSPELAGLPAGSRTEPVRAWSRNSDNRANFGNSGNFGNLGNYTEDSLCPSFSFFVRRYRRV
jgi:hypothetical protein